MNAHNEPLLAALRSARVTREVVVAAGALDRIAEVVRGTLGAAQQVIVIADTITQAAAGDAVVRRLAAAGVPSTKPWILDGTPRLKPRVETAERIAARLRDGEAIPLAVGSGVLNDLVKYAAALCDRPYIAIPTAASMDGYAASGAALLNGTFKQTMPCPPPVAVVADLDVLARAPRRMASWGYGDLAGKVVAGADWILADALGVEPLDEAVFAMVQGPLPHWLERPQRLAVGDAAALGDLLSGLLVSGFAMQAHGNSRPASGSDHQFSHLWEMENLTVDGEPAAHGACVGVGCVAMLALYEWLVAQPLDDDDIARALASPPDAAALARELAAAFGGSPVEANAVEEMRAKRAAGDRGARLRRLAKQWPALRDRLAALPTASEMQWRLRATGGVGHPAELGIPLAKLKADHRRARLIRRRYTVLDVVEDLGWLDRATEALFGAGGFWDEATNECATRGVPAGQVNESSTLR